MMDKSNNIHLVNQHGPDFYTYYPVVIVGAGESGIALGCRLKQELGFDQFRIFDRQSGFGGTWWINRYPNVACDVPALFYSFSWSPKYDWSTFFPTGPEFLEYLQDVVQKHQITDKIQLNTDVSGIRWLEQEQLWEVTLLHLVPGAGDVSAKERQTRIKEKGEKDVYIRREVVRAKIVASAVGGLVEPKGWPDAIPGREEFKGEVFHSARWNYDVDLNEKDIIVIGTGCSAAQFVPALYKPPYNAKSVTHIMRSPPWVVPRPPPPFGAGVWHKYTPTLFSRVPGFAKLFRLLQFTISELDFQLHFFNTRTSVKARATAENKLLQFMRYTVPEQYHEILTPNYGFSCKRRIIESQWFESLNEPNVDLTTQPLTSIQPHGVTLGPGRMYPSMDKKESKVPTDEVQKPADVIILANGYDVTTWLHPLRVTGRNGIDLQEEWDRRGGPQAYMGSAMDGFPNFFIIFGPNTATGHSSVILATENMVNYTLKFMKKILSGHVSTFEVKREAEEDWTAQMQMKLKDTVWTTGGCQSWYFRKDGWNAALYP